MNFQGKSLIGDWLWKPIAKNVAAGLIGAASAYAIDRGFFDAELANSLANWAMNHVLAALQ